MPSWMFFRISAARVVQVVQNELEQVGVRSGGDGVEEVARNGPAPRDDRGQDRAGPGHHVRHIEKHAPKTV
jgi:hypothetical protein